MDSELITILHRRLQESPKETAFTFLDGHTVQELTFEQLHRRVTGVRKMLLANGLRQGDACVLYIRNKLHLVLAALGALSSGITAGLQLFDFFSYLLSPLDFLLMASSSM